MERASLNQYTVKPLSLIEAADACVRHDIPAIGLWRDKISEIGVKRAAREIEARGLHVSSICRGGFFTASSDAERKQRYDDNLRAIDETAALRADVLVLVCGPPVHGDLPLARRQIEESIGALLPYAQSVGVRLGVEPLHPMLIERRSAITSLGEANDLVDRLDASGTAGVVVDSYNVFWDAHADDEIARAGRSIFAYQIADWVTPDNQEDITAARALPGDGCIDFAHLQARIDATGYAGFVEIEVLNSHLWAGEQEEVVRRAAAHFSRLTAPAL